MIRVHGPGGDVREFASCNGWTGSSTNGGYLDVTKGTEVMATFAPGYWLWIEDVDTSDGETCPGEPAGEA